MKQLTFDQEYQYSEDEEGIPIEVKLSYAGQNLEVRAKVDPGSAVCLFSNEIGRRLGIPVEQGIPKRLGGLAGTLDAFMRLRCKPATSHFKASFTLPSILAYNAIYLVGRAGCVTSGSA